MRVHQDEESLQCLSDSVTLFGIAKPAALTNCHRQLYNIVIQSDGNPIFVGDTKPGSCCMNEVVDLRRI